MEYVMMNGTSLKHRLERARSALNQTLQIILDINKRRKNRGGEDTELKHRLRILNKIVQTHALLVKLYERKMDERPSPSLEPVPAESKTSGFPSGWQREGGYTLLYEKSAAPTRRERAASAPPPAYRPDFAPRRRAGRSQHEDFRLSSAPQSQSSSR